MTAAEAFLNKRPIDSQTAQSVVRNLSTHTQKLDNLMAEFTNTIRPNIRQQFQTSFENFDQKTNQLFNILSTVLKNQKEMTSGITRNIN
jgi:hypothetical protein